MENKKDRFKKKGQNIINSRPNSMRDFLEDQQRGQMRKDAIAQLNKTTKPQTQKSANVQNRNYTNPRDSYDSERDTEKLERIHVQIRMDLARKLIEMVYARKRAGKKATQRHIIEQALEEYFEK